MTVWAIVVAAGGGERFGAAKQFARLAGATLLDRSVAAALRACGHAVVVLPEGAEWEAPAGVVTAIGGATRAASVRAGLAAVPADAEVVIVHDAARPLASPLLFAAVVAAVRDGADAALPAQPVRDTLKRVEGGRVTATIDRDGVYAAQTPQAFRAALLRAAHAAGGEGTDDAALVEACGATVVVVPGEAANLKITTPEDLEVAAALLAAP